MDFSFNELILRHLFNLFLLNWIIELKYNKNIAIGYYFNWHKYETSFISLDYEQFSIIVDRRTDIQATPTSQRRYDDSNFYFRCYHAWNNPSYCNGNVKQDPCCTRRMFHVEPFVQPTLLENWVILKSFITWLSIEISS